MSSINVNTINEYTGANGVTIDGVLIKDGEVDGVDVSGITQGITMADAWRLTSNFTVDVPNGVVDTNWERVDTYGYGGIGTGLTESSGVFTFPQTGIYKIDFFYSAITGGGEVSWYYNLQTTTDNSSYNSVVSTLRMVSGTANMYGGGAGTGIFDVTDTSTHKIRFFNGTITGTAPALTGNTSISETGFNVIRLGDT